LNSWSGEWTFNTIIVITTSLKRNIQLKSKYYSVAFHWKQYAKTTLHHRIIIYNYHRVAATEIYMTINDWKFHIITNELLLIRFKEYFITLSGAIRKLIIDFTCMKFSKNYYYQDELKGNITNKFEVSLQEAGKLPLVK
jgi:hypothetical protein